MLACLAERGSAVSIMTDAMLRRKKRFMVVCFIFDKVQILNG